MFGKTLIISFLFIFFATSAQASDSIKIGVTLGLSGKYSEMSKMQMKGFKLWEKDVNDKGGLLGKRVKLIIYDDQSNPRKAKNLYEHLILNDKVDLVLGPYSSEITEAILPVTEEHGFPVIASGASADRIWQKGYKYVFGSYAPASAYSIGFLELLVRNNFQSIAIVYADDSFSKDIAEGTKKWAERFKLKVVMFESFKKDTENLDELAQKARAAKAEALMVGGHLVESIRMRISLKRINWAPKAYFASVGPAMQAFYNRLKADANHVFSASQWEHSIPMPFGCEEFYEAYVKTYNEKPSYHAATAYAGGQILEIAVKRAKTLDRELIRNTLYSMDALSITGRYSVDKTGMQIKHQNLIIQWQKGKKEIIWPEGRKTANPVFR